MTKAELKKRLDAIVGLESTVVTDHWETRLQYYSPTGVLLFDIDIYSTGTQWKFGGHSSALPGLRRELHHVGK